MKIFLIMMCLLVSCNLFAGEVEGRLAAISVRGSLPEGSYEGVCRTDASVLPSIPCTLKIEAQGDSYVGKAINKNNGSELFGFQFHFDKGGWLHHDRLNNWDMFTFVENPYSHGINFNIEVDESSRPARPIEFYYEQKFGDFRYFSINFN